ncbi:hypothetical protein NL489_29150, partial [Klebsiella pneumoniae]|nr:hypothetical protein [Klebsiella pneumoniae]
TTNGLGRQTVAVSEPTVRAHAKLTAGVWPTAAQATAPDGTAAVPVALSSAAAGLMGLHLGQTATLGYARNAAPTTFVVVGEFR